MMRRVIVAGFAVAVMMGVLSGCAGMAPLADASGPSGPSEGTELPAFGRISPREAADVLESKLGQPGFVLLDIRTTPEVESGHIGGAIMIDYYSERFREQLDQLNRAATYLIYCRTGNRTGSAYRLMEELGFESVYDLDGGITQWTAQGYPVCVGALDAEHLCTTISASPDS